ncbi:MAG TPA: selenocysteine-specific translation elongation factor [Vicinamibacterales bacterium]|jgi:selenocysteine-specific elongation factor
MRHIIVGTAGHIDHGKSALVRALTGTDPDRLKEEKARGITIDLGFAHWSSGDFTFSFVDVPGHERFVKNMLAGVGGFDAVVLVVAADESVMPQTREHFEICRLLQVPSGLIAITKSDLADAETIELVRMEVRELTAGSFLADAPVVAVSSKTGDGLDRFERALIELARRVPPRGRGGAVRIPIDRAFSVKGFGTVVTGTLQSGQIRVDEELQLLPPARPVKVRGVQVHGEAESAATAGQRVAVNLAGIDLGEVGRGDSLVTPGVLEPTRVIDARVAVVVTAHAIRHGARVRVHQGTSEILGRVALAAVLDRVAEPGPARTGETAEIPPGREAYVRIRLERPAVLSRGDRFILRAYSPPTTIAGGLVLDPHPLRGPIRTAAARARFLALDPEGRPAEEATDQAVASMVTERGIAGLAVSSLTSRAGVAPQQVAETIARLVHSGTAVRAADVLVAPAVLEALSRQVMAMLGEYHRTEPLSEGMPREEVRERAFARAGLGVFEHVVGALQDARRVAGRDRLSLASHRVALSGEEERGRQVIERAILDGALKPPDPQAVAASGGIPPDVLDRVVKLLVRQKVLVKLDTLVFHDDALKQLKREIAALKAASGGETRIDVATFKERYGISRKFAIPLLEYLDRERVTRRVGDSRVLI